MIIEMFGNKAEKAARLAAADEWLQRLLDLSVADLAAEIMPAFGPGGASKKIGARIGTLQVVLWLMRQGPHAGGQFKAIIDPVREGLQALEHAGLILRVQSGDSSYCQATRLGLTALSDGSVRSYVNQAPAYRSPATTWALDDFR